VSYVLSYDQQDFLQDGGVSKSFTHKMAAWEICLQDGGVSESFTHKMAAWEFCLQDGGFSERFTHKMAAFEFCLQDGGDKQNENKNNVEYILRLHLVNVA